MSTPVKITFRNIDPSPSVEADIRKHAEGLERFDPRLQWCNVVVEVADKHKHQGRLYNIAVNMGLPGKTLHVNHAGPKDMAHSDIYVAIRDSFKAATRQIEDYARIRRQDVKTHDVPNHGRVVKLFAKEGYGFIETAAGEEVYFHRNSVVDGQFDKLKESDEVRVEFAVNESEKGPQATTVKPIGKHHLVE